MESACFWGRIGGLPTILGPTHSMSATQAPDPQQAERTTLSGEPIKALYGPEDVPDHATEIGSSGRVPVHARRLPVDVPRAAVDDAPVRRLRHRRGDQRALPLPARPRPDGPEHRVRHAEPDGPRLRLAAQPRRGRPRGRRDRHARRHGDALPGHRPRRRHGLDDHQRARGDDARLLRRRGRGERRAARTSSAARSRPTSSRSTSPRRSGASRSTRRCACSAT